MNQTKKQTELGCFAVLLSRDDDDDDDDDGGGGGGGGGVVCLVGWSVFGVGVRVDDLLDFACFLSCLGDGGCNCEFDVCLC